jgi:formyltetrahydrofolate-dependent phosphoribosylglycinamide formyltransferase
MLGGASARLAVLISGNGSNLQAVLAACAAGALPAQVVVVVSNNPGAYGLERAARAGIPTSVLVKQKDQDRRAYDTELARVVSAYRPDWVLLAGWMRILSTPFLDAFPNRVINLHPALPGTFPGTHAIERAYQAFRQGQIGETGVMVHLVSDEQVDCGPVLGQERVPILASDTLETLETRVHQVEHTLLVQTLNQVVRQSPSIQNG